MTFFKRWIGVWAIFLCSILSAEPLQERTLNAEALAELAYSLGIPRDANLIQESQKHWLRKPNQERWEMAELSADKKEIVLKWAKEQGFFDEWKPARRTYDQALVFGGSTSRMHLRLNYLKTLWETGVRFEKIVWLTGDRPLDPQADDYLDLCETESQAARIIWQEADLPEAMRSLSVIFIAVPMKQEGATLRRPNTVDTLVEWLSMCPEPCRVLFISNQPYCGYQFAVVHSCLPPAFEFDLAGPGDTIFNHPAGAAAVLDTVARWIYTANPV